MMRSMKHRLVRTALLQAVAMMIIIMSKCLQAQTTPIDTTKFPAPDDFVPCDREPTADLSEIERRLVFPQEAVMQDIDGKVLVRVLVDIEGKVRRCIVDQSVHPLLDAAAVKALLETTFKPAILKSQPISCWVTVPIVFKITGKAAEDTQDVKDADASYDKLALRDFTKLLVSDSIVAHLHAHVKFTETGRILTLELRDGNRDVTERYPSLVQAVRKTPFFPARDKGVSRSSEVEFDVDLPMK